MTNRPNILLIVLDDVRYDHCSYSGYENNNTPNIDSIEDGIFFHNAFSTSTWSLPSYASLLTGLYPTQHGVHTGVDGNPYLISPTFVEDLQRLGYVTTAFSRNPLVCSLLGFNRGFENFYELPTSRFFDLSRYIPRRVDDPAEQSLENFLRKAVRMSRRWIYYHISYLAPLYFDAEETNKRIQFWLNKTDKPFFLFLIYMDVHDYHFRPEGNISSYITHLKEKLVGPNITSYSASLAYLDRKLGELFRLLKLTKFFDETAIILVSDHGEMLGEKGARGHGSRYPHEELLHVPLIVKDPNTTNGEIHIEKPFSIKDIGHIISHIAEGRSCLEYIKTYPEWCGAEAMGDIDDLKWKRDNRGKKYHAFIPGSPGIHRAIITKSHMLIHNVDEDEYGLYNRLGRSVIFRESDSNLEELASILRAWEEELVYMGSKHEFTAEEEEEIINRLKSLGYITT